MFPSKALLSLIFISLSVGATPITRSTGKATLNFATRFNAVGPLNVAEKDRARVQALKNGHLGKRDGTIDATNNGVQYVAEVGVGSPATNYSLLIDTGSANTWVGAGKAYVPTSTSHDTGNTVAVSYGYGIFYGEEYTDTVTLGPSLIIKQQFIGVASTVYGIQGFDGFLGVGPVDLTQGTVSNTSTVPTVMDNLLLQGTISKEVLGMYFVPASESQSGKLTFGGVDTSVITSPVKYVSLSTSSLASKHWGIDLSISYAGQIIMSETAGIVNTDITFILIASDAFSAYQQATGGTLDKTTGLLRISSSQYANLQTLTFDIGGTSYDLAPNAQIWPRSLNAKIGGTPDSIYLIVSDVGTNSQSRIDFVLGYTFLERYYSVFDTTNRRIGFAPTSYTKSEIN